ncbi:MAG: hypothetical protein ACXWDO_11090 [Bacteroidia bacterium]
MKKLFFGLIALISVSAQSHAQTRPVTGDRSVTFGINGLQFINFNTNVSRTGSLLFRQYIADDKAIRASANLAINSNSTSLDDTSNGIEQTTLNRNTNFNIAIGMQKSLGARPRVEPYIGIDAVLGLSGTTNRQRTEITNANKTGGVDQNGDFVETETTTSTPFRLGIAPLIGFNYYIVDGIALGAEFSYGLNMAFGAKGKTITERRENGTNQPKQEAANVPSSFNYSLNTLGASSVTFSVFF